MEILKNATCIPHVSGKLIFGYSLNLKSLYECESRWNMLSDLEKSKFTEISKMIRNDVLFSLIPLQSWNKFQKLEFSREKMFYFMSYPSQIYLFPHLAENQILRKCGEKLKLIKKEKYILKIIDRYLENIAKYTFI